MTRVDFYQLSRDPVERVVSMLAGKVLQTGERLLVVCADAGRRQALSDALWAAAGREDRPVFLAHGMAGEPDAERQPVLLAGDCNAANGATMAIVADGQWREEAETFARVMLPFDGGAAGEARELWRMLAARDDIDNRIFKQRADGGWAEGG